MERLSILLQDSTGFMFIVGTPFIGVATAYRTYAYHLTSDHHILGLPNSAVQYVLSM